jgi:hypothetical protein
MFVSTVVPSGQCDGGRMTVARVRRMSGGAELGFICILLFQSDTKLIQLETEAADRAISAKRRNAADFA